MDSFFLSKLIEGEAKGAKGCAPHSVQPTMPHSCSCTLPFVCPLCAQSREGVGHRLWVWVRALVRLPPLRIHGGQGTTSVPMWPPVHTLPLRSSQGEGGHGFPVDVHPRLRVALCAKWREGGAASRFAPHLSACRTNGEGPAPLPRTPCSRTASVQKPRRGGMGLRAAPACKRGEEGGPPHCFWDWVALACRRRVREGEGRAKGGGFPFPHGPVLATPSQSHAPPWFV